MTVTTPPLFESIGTSARSPIPAAFFSFFLSSPSLPSGSSSSPSCSSFDALTNAWMPALMPPLIIF